MSQTTTAHLRFLKDLWDDKVASKLEDDPLDLLRYRSNLLGADLRITNFAGGNTSSKMEMPDPFSGQPVRVLAVKGSGGDLGSITKSGFALLYLDKLEQLISLYEGEEHEDEMVAYLSAVRVRRKPSRRLYRHASARFSSVPARRPLASRTGLSHSPRAPTASRRWRNSTSDFTATWRGCRGSVPALNWA